MILTFNPNAHPESTSCDGFTYYTLDNATWAALVAGAGSAGAANGATFNLFSMRGDATAANKYDILGRSILLFDVTVIPSGAVIDSAVFSVYGQAKADALVATPNVNIYASAPASNTDVAAGDFDSIGTTPYCDTPVTYAGFSVTGYNAFTLNAAGLAALQTAADGDNIFKIGARNANYDVANSAPPYVAAAMSYIVVYAADTGGATLPKLVVTYHFDVTCTDGLTLGDTTTTLVVLNSLATDGVVLGDALGTTGIFNSLASDGISLGDTLTYYLDVYLLATDGISLGDSNLAGLVYSALATDGIYLGDAAEEITTFKRILRIVSTLLEDLKIVSTLLNDLTITPTETEDLSITSTLTTDLEITSDVASDLDITSTLEGH